jgi:hypothetical protein
MAMQDNTLVQAISNMHIDTSNLPAGYSFTCAPLRTNRNAKCHS